MESLLPSTARRLAAIAAHVLAATLAGCALRPFPSDVDPRAMRIAAAAAPAVDVDRLRGGQAHGAALGGATGIGAGALVTAIACAPSTVFLPICVMAVGPTAMTVGGLSGAAIGAARTEPAADAERKLDMLREEIATSAPQDRLADALRGRLQPRAPTRASAWTLEVALAELKAEARTPYALRLTVRATLRRADDAAAVWFRERVVLSNAELATDDWIADDHDALRAVIARCIEEAAVHIALDIEQGRAAPVANLASLPCGDPPRDRTADPVAGPASAPTSS